MGRIKTQPVKRATNEIFEKYKEEISRDYEKNKEFLKGMEIHSKKIRNIIAGYLTRLAKAQGI